MGLINTIVYAPAPSIQIDPIGLQVQSSSGFSNWTAKATVPKSYTTLILNKSDKNKWVGTIDAVSPIDLNKITGEWKGTVSIPAREISMQLDKNSNTQQVSVFVPDMNLLISSDGKDPPITGNSTIPGKEIHVELKGTPGTGESTIAAQDRVKVHFKQGDTDWTRGNVKVDPVRISVNNVPIPSPEPLKKIKRKVLLHFIDVAVKGMVPVLDMPSNPAPLTLFGKVGVTKALHSDNLSVEDTQITTKTGSAGLSGKVSLGASILINQLFPVELSWTAQAPLSNMFGNVYQIVSLGVGYNFG